MIKVISNINTFKRTAAKTGNAIPQGMKRGLGRWTVLANKAAKKLLSGSGKAAAHSYPVPVRTGQLRRAESYVLPGQAKHGIKARNNEAFLVNMAQYASVIHKARPFMTDAIAGTRSAGMEMIRQSTREAMMKAWKS